MTNPSNDLQKTPRARGPKPSNPLIEYVKRPLFIDADGFVWNDNCDEPPTISMARTNPANAPTPEPYTYLLPAEVVWLLVEKVLALAPDERGLFTGRRLQLGVNADAWLELDRFLGNLCEDLTP